MKLSAACDKPAGITRRSAMGALGAFACMALPALPRAQPLAPLHICISADSYQTMQGAWIELIYREAFRRIGQSMHLQIVPSKRGSAMLDSGQIDGELNRVAMYGDGYPHRLLVPEPHFYAAFVAYGLAERELQKQVPAPQLSSIASVQLGLRKLMARRTDIFVEVDMIAETALATEEFRTRGIRPVAVLAKVSAHAYLHSRHARLVPLLAAALVEMKKEGLVEKYRTQAFSMAPPRLPNQKFPAALAKN